MVFESRWGRASAHASLAVYRHAHHAIPPHAQHSQRLQHRGVRFFTHNDSDGRRAKEAVILSVPSGAGQKSVPGSGQGRKVGHGGSGHHRAACSLRKPEHLPYPFESDLLQGDGGGRLHKKRCILVPGAHQPGGSQRHGQAAAVHKAKEAAIILGHGRRRAVLVQQVQHRFCAGRPRRQRAPQGAQRGDSLRGGSDRAGVHAFQVIHCVARGALQKSGAGLGWGWSGSSRMRRAGGLRNSHRYR